MVLKHTNIYIHEPRFYDKHSWFKTYISLSYYLFMKCYIYIPSYTHSIKALRIIHIKLKEKKTKSAYFCKKLHI